MLNQIIFTITQLCHTICNNDATKQHAYFRINKPVTPHNARWPESGNVHLPINKQRPGTTAQ